MPVIPYSVGTIEIELFLVTPDDFGPVSTDLDGLLCELKSGPFMIISQNGFRLEFLVDERRASAQNASNRSRTLSQL